MYFFLMVRKMARAMRDRRSLSHALALAAAVTLTASGLLLCSAVGPAVAWRLARNPLCDKVPPALPPSYQSCSDDELTDKISVVMTVKDTCSQAASSLADLADKVPRSLHVLYVHPDFVGCRSVNPDVGLFPRFTLLKTAADASPIDGFLAAQPYLRTPFALLMHNDVLLLDYKVGVCELMRALQAHPEAAFAAPQIYERSENGIVVPHGHQAELHLSRNNVVSYDVDFDLLTQRLPSDFPAGGGPQIHFLEDHAFMARSSSYALYLDPKASFTMEYLDSILAMRSRGTFPWYVPTARVLFDVDVGKLGWRDIPYFVHKRSERVGLQVRDYLSAKWRADFPNSGIWNYVKYSFLHNLNLGDNELPQGWEEQRALYLGWLESIGLDRFDGWTLHDRLHLTEEGWYDDDHDDDHNDDGAMLAWRASYDPTTAVHEGAKAAETQAATAAELLPRRSGEAARKAWINITLPQQRIPISFSLTDRCRPEECGMLIVDGGRCFCFVYHSPFDLSRDYGAAWLLDVLKLPSRIVKFAQMKYTTASDTHADAFFRCGADEAACAVSLPSFSPRARMIKWGWFTDRVQ